MSDCDNAHVARILSAIRRELDDDFVGLWEIIRLARDGSDAMADEAVRALTLRIVRDLLQDETVYAGDTALDFRTLAPWNLSVDETLERINKAWDSLGREPNVWEIVTFAKR